MKRVIFGITAVILCLGMVSCTYFGYKYYTFNKVDVLNKKIKAVKKEIKDIYKISEEKNREIENIKHENEEKVRVLELWKKALSQVKKDS